MRRWRGGGIDVLSFELWGSKGMDLGDGGVGWD